MKKTLYGILTMGFLLASWDARAIECSNGQGEECTNSAQCGNYEMATVCVDSFGSANGTCEIPCQDEEGEPVPNMCTMGETCIQGLTDGYPGKAYYCKPSQFMMDLNLLDSCIQYFVEGLPPPDFLSTNECSLERNLNQMLDQTGDAKFNIFDVDGCINSFLDVQKETCDCPANSVQRGVSCFTDLNCLDGERCDTELNLCRTKDIYNQERHDATCNTDVDCLSGERCDDDFNFCRAYCELDADCGVGTSCNKNTHFCECDNPVCPEDDVERVPCATDEECGMGLFCDPEMRYCQRECGFIVDRTSSISTDTLERTCSGNLKVCEYYRGKCEKVDIDDATCLVDSDCPSGAYCFVGYCEPKCYSAIQCPDSNWYCSKANTCLPVPPLGGEGEEPFDPMDYSLLFSQRKFSMDTLNDEYKIPLLIMNLKTRKQVINQPNVVFGYRMEIKYELKQEGKCNQNFSELYAEELSKCGSKECEDYWNTLKNEIIEDCIIDDTEEFITVENPFGTVYGAGDPTIDLRLNYGAVDELTPGLYMATVRIIFNNGDTDQATVTFQKTSPNGEYTGQLTVYRGGPENSLGTSNLEMKLFIDTDAPQVEWDELLKQNNMYEEKEYLDVTRGFPITGHLSGNTSVVFNNPAAQSRKDNIIPVKGIYAAHLGQIRLTTVIEIGKGFCRSEDGHCDPSDPRQLQVDNVFDRDLRRLIEFVGPFDYKNRRFTGGYRETISGLVPAGQDLTLEGTFHLRQTRQDDSEIELDDPLLEEQTALGFPERYQILSRVQEDIDQYCGGFEGEDNFDADSSFDSYMNQFDGADGPIFEEMIFFEGEIGRALDELENNQQNYLTLSDYLKGQIEFCPEGWCNCTEEEISSGGCPISDNCICYEKLRCGLALYRKAILSMRPDTESSTQSCDDDEDCADGLFCNTGKGECQCGGDADCGPGNICNASTHHCQDMSNGWVNMANVAVSEGYNSYTLFCPELPLYGSDCLISATENPTLVSLQEHNRFYKELVQTLSYEAGNALSDAFYVMYKAYEGDELDADSAFEHKELRYYDALDSYNELRQEFFSPEATAIKFQWPMRWFATIGNSWLQYMNTVGNDRLDTLIDMMDMRRRILQDTDESDYVFAQHLLHEEYLTQVFIFVLQEHWQNELFAYTGFSADTIEKGNILLSRVNEMRNPLGFHPNRIYFENSDLTLNNWQNYKRRVEQELVRAEESVAQAIQNMKGALSDKDNLETSLLHAAHAFDSNLEQYCGSDEPLPKECTMTLEERELATSCTGAGCLFDWTCDKDGEKDCDRVVQAFTDTVEETDAHGCRADSRIFSVRTNNQDRLCVRGQMGTLLQEGQLLKLQIEQTYGKVEGVLRSIAREQTYLAETQSDNAALMKFLGEQALTFETTNNDIREAQSIFDFAFKAADAIVCELIVGVAMGTDCPQTIVMAILQAEAMLIKDTMMNPLYRTLDELHWMKEEYIQSYGNDKEIAQLRKNLDTMVAQVESYILEYQLLIQQLFNNELKIADTYYVAQQTAARYNEVVGSIVDRLIGRETGSVLLRNAMVKESNERFQEVLLETYKMAQAFIHRYNYGVGAQTVANKVYQLQTIDDVKDFIEELTKLEDNYCGAQGLDCDNKHNQKIFRLSMRDALYPKLQDIVDPKTGSVLTKGEQFHNEITSSLRLLKRKRDSNVRKQIELPIQIWMAKGGGISSNTGYMVNPEECNHFIVGQRNGGMTSAGTIAVNVVGTRLSENIEYELWRNDTDYIRSCNEKVSEVERKVNLYTVGWTPQHAFGQLDQPDSFLTHSLAFTACKNNWRLEDVNTRNSEDSCYNYFARGRSLGTLDMRFVIPFLDDEQSWILGDGLPDNEKPIIEDIVLYFRYNSEPIFSDGL